MSRSCPLLLNVDGKAGSSIPVPLWDWKLSQSFTHQEGSGTFHTACLRSAVIFLSASEAQERSSLFPGPLSFLSFVYQTNKILLNSFFVLFVCVLLFFFLFIYFFFNISFSTSAEVLVT